MCCLYKITFLVFFVFRCAELEIEFFYDVVIGVFFLYFLVFRCVVNIRILFSYFLVFLCVGVEMEKCIRINE